MERTSPLLGRTAVVTGAARGIGEALAHEMARRGARVALLGLEEQELARVAADLPGEAAHWSVDVTDDAAMSETARLVERVLGPPSVLVANAGVAAGGPFVREDAQTSRRVFEVNLIGSANTARAFLPALLRTGGYLLQVSSMAALAPAPMLAAYCASKSGAEAFAQSLRAEVVHRGVGVGVAYLSWTDTDMIQAADDHTALRELRRRLPWPATKTYPVQPVAQRLVRGIERRDSSVYAQPWLRAVRAGRAFAPGLVTFGSRRVLERRDHDEDLAATGPLGAGGAAAVHGNEADE